MSKNILNEARKYLVNSLKGKRRGYEITHPWRKDWEFEVLHSLRVESYVLKILARENHSLSEHEITLLRLAAILHDIAKLGKRENHAESEAHIVGEWLQDQAVDILKSEDVTKLLEMIADHSKKAAPELDYPKAVLKDADTLDEIGVMSIFMTSNWLEQQSPFFFYDLRKRLIDFELPFCDKKFSILNTEGAKEILREKKSFVENFIAQLTDELTADQCIEQMLLGYSKDNG